MIDFLIYGFLIYVVISLILLALFRYVPEKRFMDDVSLAFSWPIAIKHYVSLNRS